MLPSGIGALEAPGCRSPVSAEPSVNRTLWTTTSLFFQMTIRPAGTAAGLGENDCAPFTPVMLIVTGVVSAGASGAAGAPPQAAASVAASTAAGIRRICAPFDLGCLQLDEHVPHRTIAAELRLFPAGRRRGSYVPRNDLRAA
jgi:hypothetical protein